ncbi:MAG TPA: 6-carboxytetrahydropterin synthase [bacterium]|nr:6-carboxytetrahydropterin synthase [bacterium]
MATASLTRIVQFSASHRLHVPSYSAAKNRQLFGKCNSPNGHGHNYKAEVTVTGEVNPETGMVISLTVLKEIIEDTVVRQLDHRNLNLDVPHFKKANPTAENIAIEIWRMISKRLPKSLSLEIKLFETDKNVVIYRGK